MSEPTIVTRAAQPYMSITGQVTMRQIPEIADRLPEVFQWLGARGVEPAGEPFFKYNIIDMERELEIEVGVPVAEALAGDETVRPGVLPAGRYATVTHVGHPQQLVGAARHEQLADGTGVPAGRLGGTAAGGQSPDGVRRGRRAADALRDRTMRVCGSGWRTPPA
jgi:hypothetical protein